MTTPAPDADDKTFYDKMPASVAELVKETRKRVGHRRFALAFAAGLDLARRSQDWKLADDIYGDEEKCTVRFILPGDVVAELERLKQTFARPRQQLTVSAIHHATLDRTANAIAETWSLMERERQASSSAA